MVLRGKVINNMYEQLGFKQPEYLENPYGIKIYIGTKDKDDWGVVIPKSLAKAKCRYYNCNSDYVMYLVTEQEALEKARVFTEFAKHLK